LPLSGGATVRAYIRELYKTVEDVKATNDPAFGPIAARLGETVEQLARATKWLLTTLSDDPDRALAGATPYLRLFGLAAGGCMLAGDALTAARETNGAVSSARLIATARFFATNLTTASTGLADTVIEGADAFQNLPADQIG
jgi:hypothetical protein